jgi:hypothetical protein
MLPAPRDDHATRALSGRLGAGLSVAPTYGYRRLSEPAGHTAAALWTGLPRPAPGKTMLMSMWSRFKKRRREKMEQQRSEAVARAMARGATPEEAAAAGERAARGNTAVAVMGAINT